MDFYIKEFEMNKLKQEIKEKINSMEEFDMNNISCINGNGISKKVIIQTSDNKNYLVNKEILCCSALLKDLLDNDDDENINIIPITVNSSVIPYLICYMEHHYNKSVDEIEKPIVDNFMDISSISNWDKYFVCSIIDEDEKINDLFIECLNASNFLSISKLCDLLCARFACSIGLIDMTTDMLRNIFNEVNDLTEEEEKKIIDELNFIENSYSDNMNKNMFCSNNNKNDENILLLNGLDTDQFSNNDSDNNYESNDEYSDESNDTSDDDSNNESNSDGSTDNESNLSND